MLNASIFVLSLTFILSFYFFLRRKYDKLFILLIISFGLGAFNFYLGTLWFPYKTVTIFIFLSVLRFSIPKRNFNLFIILSIFSMVVGILFSPPIYKNITFLQSPEFRPIVQLYTYITLASILPYCYIVINSPEKIPKLLFWYYRMSEIVLAFGLIHFIFIIMGKSFLPILRMNSDARSAEAGFGIEGIRILRVYGISGEPKSLGTFLLPYFFISLFNYYKGNYNVSRLFHIFLSLLSLLIIIYTFSSAALLALMAGIAFMLIFWWSANMGKIIPLAFILLVAIFMLNSTYKSTYSESKFSIQDVIFERSIGRIQDEADERYETVALNYITKEKPFFLISGLGLGMYNFHLPFLSFSRGTEPIDSGWVVILLDYGIIGIIFFTFLFFQVFNFKRYHFAKHNDTFNSFILAFVIAYLANMGNNALYLIFLFGGLSLASFNVLRKEKLSKSRN